MVTQSEEQDSARFEFYTAQYARFAGSLARQMRREVYGEDLGQQGWRTIDEQNRIAEFLHAGPYSHILDVGCGSGGPSLALAERTGARVTGIDIEAAAIAFGQAESASRQLGDRATFQVLDCAAPLPFEDGTFDGVACVDAISHFGDRTAILAEWARLLRTGGRVVLIDAVVITGAVTKKELDIRMSIGPFTMVPPGMNEHAIESAGLVMRRQEDATAAIAQIAARWHAVRADHAAALEAEEGTDWFAQRQEFLATTADLAATGRLSRILYVAEKVELR